MVKHVLSDSMDITYSSIISLMTHRASTDHQGSNQNTQCHKRQCISPTYTYVSPMDVLMIHQYR